MELANFMRTLLQLQNNFVNNNFVLMLSTVEESRSCETCLLTQHFSRSWPSPGRCLEAGWFGICIIAAVLEEQSSPGDALVIAGDA